MPRHTWDELPAVVRTAIERKTGPVTATQSPSTGRNSDFSATLHTPAGPVFCKAIADADSPRGRMHRHEAAINPFLPPALAPTMRWRTAADGWLILGFDHVNGRHADLSPNSPHLPAVTTTITALTTSTTPAPPETPRLADQWRRLAPWRRLANTPTTLTDTWTTDRLDELQAWETHAAEHADGDSLIHTDLHAYNILVWGDNARLVDWAWSRTGNPAVDIAFLTTRLIAAGHEPAAAEQWADQFLAWKRTDTDKKTALAVAIWGIWTYKNSHDPRPLWDTLIPAARAWAQHRLAKGA